MNHALRWMLILGCLMLAVLEAPRSSALVVEDLGGPYGAVSVPEAASVEFAPPPALLARSELDAGVADVRADSGTK